MTDALAGKVVNPKAVLTGSAPLTDETEGMSYLHSLPRRLVTVYLPLSVILFVLLFPFYWMALTSIKPDEQLLDLDTYSPFWTWNPTLKHIYQAAVRNRISDLALEHDAGRRLRDRAVDHRQRARRLCNRAATL